MPRLPRRPPYPNPKDKGMVPDAAGLPVFSAKEARFVNNYVEFEDLPIAAVRSGLTTDQAKSFMRRKKVKQEIDRRLHLVHVEQAKLLAKHRNAVSVPFLDDALVTAIQKGSKRGDVAALQMGYGRVGMMRDREFIGAPNPNAQPTLPGGGAARPMIYRALERTTTTVTERAVTAEEKKPDELPAAPKGPEILAY